MAQHRPKVPAETKRALVEEAGGKCANPGCANRLTELHHIKKWAIYETHDAGHMIALCPACHDQVERGPLRISDEDLYRWKTIERGQPIADFIYIEPPATQKEPILQLGSVQLVTKEAGSWFTLAPTQHL